MLQQIFKECQNYSRILIHRHVNPDPDALGSQLGLSYLLKKAFPQKDIRCVGELPHTLAYFGKMNEVMLADYEGSLVVVLDTANAPRIDIMPDALETAAMTIKIDHHPNHDSYADMEYVDTTASSTSEIIYDFYQANQGSLQLDEHSARVLYAGIVGDTGRFLHPNTTAKTMRAASELREYPFDFVDLSRKFIEVSKEVMYLTGYVQTHFEMHGDKVASVVITNDILEKYNVTHEETASLVGLLGNLCGVEMWALFLEKRAEPTTFRCRLRSKKVPVEPIAARHNGGGHPLASGANASDRNEIQTIIEEMVAAVEKA